MHNHNRGKNADAQKDTEFNDPSNQQLTFRLNEQSEMIRKFQQAN